MRATFVHDHRFPRIGSDYCFSYGFDNEFFKRYLNIFDQFNIIARETEVSREELRKDKIANDSVNFFTIKNYKNLKSSIVRDKIDGIIDKSNCLVVRLPSILGLYAIKVANKKNIPYIVELVGCPWDAFWYQNIGKKIFAPTITILTKKAVYSAKYVVYVTDNFLQKRYPTKGESISCSNVTLHTVEDLSLLERIDKIDKFKSNKKVVIGTCGTVDAIYKGQRYVIDAITKLKSEGFSIEYQLVGGGDPSYLISLAKKLGIESSVNFLGKMKHEDVFKWLEKIDIYVQPSETEGLPRSVIEAMSKGCPIIGSNAGGIPELINRDFIFNKRDVNDFCKVFKQFTSELMKIQAKENHQKAKKFVKTTLYRRREEFFKKFINKEVKDKITGENV